MKQLKSVPPLFEERWEHCGYGIVKRQFAKRDSEGAHQILGKHDDFERGALHYYWSLGSCNKHLNEITREVTP